MGGRATGLAGALSSRDILERGRGEEGARERESERERESLSLTLEGRPTMLCYGE